MNANIKRTAARKPRARYKKDTRTRIIERSILLFNRDGIVNVAIEQIASDLEMSPGNLTYHFKRKRDLILATLEVLQEQLRIALARPVAVDSPRDGAEYLIRIYRVFWDFRFFFNGLTFLLSSDAQLRQQFGELRDWVIDTLVKDLNYLRERGYLIAPTPPNSFRLLAENLWSQWLHWLRMTQIESPYAATPANQHIADGVLHLWSLCQPWMRPDFAPELLAVFNDLLGGKLLVAPEAENKAGRTTRARGAAAAGS